MSEADTVRDLTVQANTTELIAIEAGRHYRLVTPEGSNVEEFDTDHLLEAPRRARGTVLLADPASLITYVRRHAAEIIQPELELSETARAANAEAATPALYADVDATRVTAVLNGHAPGQPGWGDFRATLGLRTTLEWKHWTGKDRTWLSQSGFAEHIEEGLAEIVEPPAAEMLEVAQSLQAHTKVDFKSQHLLANGQRQFTYAETMESKAGEKGTLEIPQTFKLGIIPFDGIEVAYALMARFQFRLDSGDLKIRYLLTRPADVLRTAFGDVVDEVEAGVGLRAFRGYRPMSDLEDNLVFQLRVAGIHQPVPELRFAPPRRWRFDLAWPERMLAVEVEGGTWNGGRHLRPQAFENDCEKYAEAVLAGWRVLRVTGHMVEDGRALALIERALRLTEGAAA